jgi:hypothetical protein
MTMVRTRLDACLEIRVTVVLCFETGVSFSMGGDFSVVAWSH